MALRSGLNAQIHALLAKEGMPWPVSDLFGTAGQALLNEVALARAYAIRVESLRDLLDVYDREVTMLEGEVARALAHHAVTKPSRRCPG